MIVKCEIAPLGPESMALCGKPVVYTYGDRWGCCESCAELLREDHVVEDFMLMRIDKKKGHG
jgi:hypothetical protein